MSDALGLTSQQECLRAARRHGRRIWALPDDLLEQARQSWSGRWQHERVTVTVDGRPSAVLLAQEDLQSLEETIAVLADSDALRQLVASDAELARGEGESEEMLGEAMLRHSASS